MTEDITATGTPSCPKCGGEMWDNRENKRNPRAPDFKCKDKNCEGVIWPPRDKAAAAPTATPAAGAGKAGGVDANGMPLCPTCGGAMWDDRESKRNPRAPDFKCRNKPRAKGEPGCEGVIWPSRDGSPSPYPPSVQRRSAPPVAAAPPRDETPFPDEPPPFDDDDLPF
jgi:hypothetical protein